MKTRVLLAGLLAAAVILPSCKRSTGDEILVGEYGSDEHEEVVIRDLDLDLIREVRNTWQFYRDRRPDSYSSIPKP